MQKKVFNFQPKGMNTELSPKFQSNEYATFMQNIRLNKEDNGTYSIQFEKDINYKKSIGDTLGTYILGYCILRDCLIIFHKVGNEDAISKVIINDEGYEVTRLIVGNFNFNIKYPIHTIGLYENENIQKVYFIDGINPIRVININYDYSIYNEDEYKPLLSTALNFVPTLKLKEEVNIVKSLNGGSFPTGTIQYLLSYYNKNGRQSNIFYQSPLYYLSTEKGLAADKKVNCNFTLNINNIDRQFDYLRIYSIIRSSKEAVPTCKRVTDIDLNNINNINNENKYIKSINNDKLSNIILYNKTYSVNNQSLNINISYNNIDGDIIHNPSLFDTYAQKGTHQIGTSKIYEYYFSFASTYDFELLNLLYNDLDNSDNIKVKKLIKLAKNKGNILLRIGVDCTNKIYNSYKEVTDYNLIDHVSIEILGSEVFDYTEIEYNINQTKYNLSYTDYNTEGDIIDNKELLYIGGNNIIPNVFEQKDNTLFLGNYKDENNDFTTKQIDDLMLNIVKHQYNNDNTFNLSFTNNNKVFTLDDNINYFSYKGELMNEDVAGFKYLEWYGFALQLQNINGKYSSPIYLGAIRNYYNSKIEGNNIYRPIVELSIAKSIFTEVGIDINIWKKIRLLMVKPTDSLRTIKCQGIISATVFNYYDRLNNSPYAMASWRMLPIGNHMKPLSSNDSKECEIQNITDTTPPIGEPISTESNSKIYVIEVHASTPENQRGHFSSVHSVSIYYEVYMYLKNSDVGKRFNIKLFTGYVSYDRLYSKYWLDRLKMALSDDIANKISTASNNGTLKLAASNDVIIDSSSSLTQLKGITYSNAYIDISTYNWGEDEIKNDLVIDKITTKEVVVSNITVKDNSLKKQNFAIDESIITFNSPDIEEQANNIDSNTKLRIIGFVHPINKFTSYSITSESPRDPSEGLIYRMINDEFKSRLIWRDKYYKWEAKFKYTNHNNQYNSITDTLFPVYLWQRESVLSDLGQEITFGDYNYSPASKLKQKIITNTRDCDTYYLCDILKYKNNCPVDKKLHGVEYTNIFAKVATTNADITYTLGEQFKYYNKGIINVFNDVNKAFPSYDNFNVKGLRSSTTTPIDILQAEADKWEDLHNLNNMEGGGYSDRTIDNSDIIQSNEATRMTYKESMNILINLQTNKYNEVNSLPVLSEKYIQQKNAYYYNEKNIPFWINKSDNKLTNYDENLILANYIINYSNYLDVDESIEDYNEIINKATTNSLVLNYNELYYIADLYETENNPYENLYLKEETAKESYKLVYNKDTINNYSFIPISDTIDLQDITTINTYKGDTYFQKWDCLKTFCHSKDDKQQYNDITSFFIESRTNLDGRYDVFRGIRNNAVINEEQFNSINKNYTQLNDFFNYRTLNTDIVEYFPNQITITNEKVLGENIDSWTNIPLAVTLDLDGNNGKLNRIIKYNNELYCFQDSGISRLLYNSRVQINTSDNVPIEIANSAKLQDKIYISNTLGSQKYDFIEETSNGIYFVDNYKKGLYLLNGEGIRPLSDGKFSKFFKDINNDNIKLMFESKYKDLYIFANNKCVAYNEGFNEFTSYYNYGINNYILNFNDESLSIINIPNNPVIGNMYVKETSNNKQGIIEFIANPEFDNDKIFEELDFTSDDIVSIDKHNVNYQSPFTSMIVSNEYQSGTTNTNLRKKFRVWRWQVPRSNGRDRIRNMWCKFRLISNNYIPKYKIYGINVMYYE